MKHALSFFVGLMCVACFVCSACNTSAPAPDPQPLRKPVLVQGATPVAAFVAEAQVQDPSMKTVVYVGATWCEPCKRFHDALTAGLLDAELQGVRFIEYDYDRAKGELALDGYTSRLIPLFALPEPDGRCSTRAIEGSVKGEAAVHGNLLPRLRELLR